MNASRLSFQTKNDALRYADHVVQRCNEWATRNNVNTPGEDYVKSKNEIWVELDRTELGLKSGHFYLVARAVPFVHDNLEWASTCNYGAGEVRLVLWVGIYDSLVRMSCESRERPEQAVPSVVRFEFHCEGNKSPVNLLALRLAGLPEIADAFTNGEIDPLTVCSAKGHRAVTHGLVEREPGFFENGGGKPPHTSWESALKSECDNLISGATIVARDNRVRATISERSTGALKFDKVFFSALD